MNALRLITAVACLGPIATMAQTVPTETTNDPVLDAIHDFNSRPPAKANEVTVVLDPPADEPAQKENTPQPILVTGRPPENVALVPAETEHKESEPKFVDPPIPEEDGLSVDVEKLQNGKGVIQSGEIKLLAPFPAKPLSPTPAGWKLDSLADVPPLKKEVELSPGKKITLTIRPHLLVPETDGATSFSITETGYNPTLGYKQKDTVGAILSRSIHQLENDSKELGTAIDNLQQLLVSLPAPEAPVSPSTPPAKK